MQTTQQPGFPNAAVDADMAATDAQPILDSGDEVRVDSLREVGVFSPDVRIKVLGAAQSDRAADEVSDDDLANRFLHHRPLMRPSAPKLARRHPLLVARFRSHPPRPAPPGRRQLMLSSQSWAGIRRCPRPSPRSPGVEVSGRNMGLVCSDVCRELFFTQVNSKVSRIFGQQTFHRLWRSSAMIGRRRT